LDGVHAQFDRSDLWDGSVLLEMEHELLHRVEEIGHLAILELRGHQLQHHATPRTGQDERERETDSQRETETERSRE
jgi:hypothetical protein